MHYRSLVNLYAMKEDYDMPTTHSYHAITEWTGAGEGMDPKSFSRDVRLTFAGRPPVDMSATPEFQGDANRVNPEEMLVGSLSSCQMLTYLFLAARNGIQIISYHDNAEGELSFQSGKMRIVRITLRPTIVVRNDSDLAKAQSLVGRAHSDCFVANTLACEMPVIATITHETGE